jgi:hypothetical protein
MKEDPRKEKQVKENETKDVRLNVSEDAGWARCPICNEIWRTCQFRHPWYGTWDVEHYGLPPGHISEEVCPVHAARILIDGRIKGKRKILNQDELNNMTKRGFRCPVCNEKNLELSEWMEDQNYFTCMCCNASIITEQSSTIDGKKEIKYCSYREDLGRVKKKSFQDILEITNSPAFVVKRM